MRLFIVIAAAVLGLSVLMGCPVGAQSAFGPARDAGTAAAAAEEGRAAPGPVERLSSAIRAQQQRFYRRFAGAIRALKNGYSLEAGFGLIAIAFAYGIFHAAGPGHGKAVISAYMLANERSMRRGVLLAALASLAQALTAIVLVYGLLLVFDAAGRRAQLAAGDLEIVSYAMIAGLGGYLLWRSLRPLLAARLRSAGAAAIAGHGHAAHPSHNGHVGGHDHAHAPDPALLGRPLTVATALPIVASIGIRPCSGAIVVLIFAHTLALHAAGVAATLAMSAGTAITVAALASLAVGSREVAAALIGRDRPAVAIVYRVAAIAGSGLVLALGIMLLHGALIRPAQPFL